MAGSGFLAGAIYGGIRIFQVAKDLVVALHRFSDTMNGIQAIPAFVEGQTNVSRAMLAEYEKMRAAIDKLCEYLGSPNKGGSVQQYSEDMDDHVYRVRALQQDFGFTVEEAEAELRAAQDGASNFIDPEVI